MLTLELQEPALPPRYPDVVWNCTFDWTPKLKDGQTVISATFEPLGADFDITNVSLDGAVSSFTVSGGEPSSVARIAALAIVTGGEKPGENILAPIRAR